MSSGEDVSSPLYLTSDIIDIDDQVKEQTSSQYWRPGQHKLVLK